MKALYDMHNKHKQTLKLDLQQVNITLNKHVIFKTQIKGYESHEISLIFCYNFFTI